MFVKKKEYANGKIIVCDFKKLNPASFYPIHKLTQKELEKSFILCAPDGRIFIDLRNSAYEFVANCLLALMSETKETLRQYKEAYQKSTPKVNTILEWEKFYKKMSDEEKISSFACIMIPIELKRREIEKVYYDKNKL